MRWGVDFIGVGTGALLFNHHGQIMLRKCRGRNNHWEFPSGAVNFGEKRREAINRILKKEHGIHAEIVKHLHVIDHIDEKEHHIVSTYLGRHLDGPVMPENANNVKWVHLYDVDVNSLSPSSRTNYLRYIKKHGVNAPIFIKKI